MEKVGNMSLHEDKLNLLKSNSNGGAGVKAETLFKQSGTEDLSYLEPKKRDFNCDVLYKDKLYEEPLHGDTHKKSTDETDVQTETLFTTGIEDISIEEDAVLEEESLKFKEPVKPEFVSEEVLFTSENEQPNLNDLSIVDSETSFLENTMLSSEDALDIDSDDYELTFGDLDDVTTSVENSLITSNVQKQIYVKKCFAEKMLENDGDILQRYDELKNILLSFKKVKSRISNTCDTFKLGKMQIAKISTSGKSLKLYLNLNLNEVESRLKCKDAGHKKAYKEVPVFLRVRSPRSMRNAKYLLNQLATKFNLQNNKKAVMVNSTELLKQKLDK